MDQIFLIERVFKHSIVQIKSSDEKKNTLKKYPRFGNEVDYDKVSDFLGS